MSISTVMCLVCVILSLFIHNPMFLVAAGLFAIAGEIRWTLIRVGKALIEIGENHETKKD